VNTFIKQLALVQHFLLREHGLESCVDTLTVCTVLRQPLSPHPCCILSDLTWHLEGHCVLTLGTDNRVDTDRPFGRWGWRLLKEHNYSVLGQLF